MAAAGPLAPSAVPARRIIVGRDPQLLLRDEAGGVDLYRALEFLQCFRKRACVAQALPGVDVLRRGSEAHAGIFGKILRIIGRERVGLLVIRKGGIVVRLGRSA